MKTLDQTKQELRTRTFSLIAGAFLAALAPSVSNGQNNDERFGSAASPEPPAKPLERVLRQYVAKAAADSELRALLLKHNITLQYTVHGSGMEFYLAVDKKSIRGDFGKPPHAPELAFASDAATLERFLLGAPGDLDIRVTVSMNFIRKLSLKKDFGCIRDALIRVYKSTVATPAPGPALLANHP